MFDCSNSFTSGRTLNLCNCDNVSATPHNTETTTRRTIRKNVFLAQIGGNEQTAAHLVILKFGRDGEARDIKREASFYKDDLRHLQGKIVPKFLGLYQGTDGGHDVSCMMLEYCSGASALSRAEYGRQVMYAASQLHEAGVVHGNLNDTHIVKAENGIRIIDFSVAIRHKCRGAYPALREPAGYVGCQELISLERVFGRMDACDLDDSPCRGRSLRR